MNKKFLLLSILSGLVGLGLFVAVLLVGVFRLPDQMKPITMPGTATVSLQETGTYTIFHEYSKDSGNEDALAENLKLEIKGPGSEPVSLSKTVGSSHYDIGNRSGYSLYNFTAETAGDYTFTGTAPDEATGSVVFTLANNFMGKLLTLIGLCFACVFVFGGLFVIFLVKALKPLIDKKK